ncbi:YIP1 family protein [Thermodesulfobacteriota bacterium]
MTVDLICPECNFTQKVPEETIPDSMRWVRCPRCNTTFEHISGDAKNSEDPLDDISGGGSSHIKSPHEIDDTGYFADLWRTFRSVLFSPAAFFGGIREPGGLKDSIAFGILFGSIGAMFSIFWRFFLMSEEFVDLINGIPWPISLNQLFITFIIISPLIVLLMIFVTAVILHIFLFILRGANNDFEATIKVSAYINTVEIFCIVPYIGGLIGLVWSIVIAVIGLKKIHETSTLKALFAVLLPFFLFFILEWSLRLSYYLISSKI